MGAPSDTNLNVKTSLVIRSNYKRTDLPVGQKAIDNQVFRDNIELTNGAGKNKANLIYRDTRTLVNSTEYLDLDGILTNLWGHTLNFDAVKELWFRNKQTEEDRYLEVHFKNERYYIGPKGVRYVLEPYNQGIVPIVSSQSAEEGQIIVSTNAQVTYELGIVGSHAESSSSSGP